MKFSKEERTMWLEDWKRNGKSAWAYAKENGLVPQTFYRWINRETKQASGFVEIPVCKKPEPGHLGEVVVEKDGIRIRIPVSVWIEYLAAIMEGLKAAA